MVQITDEQIYQEYFKRLNKELNDEKSEFLKIYSENKNYKGDILTLIKDKISENSTLFIHKYLWSGCQQLLHNEALFIKSALETARLRNSSIDFFKDSIKD